jgi:hypothetical protein
MAKRGELAPVEVRHSTRTPGITYQREHVLCGKAGCRKLHGPYWYAYWKAGGRVRKRYIGRKFHPLESREPVLGNPSAGDRLPKARPVGRPRKRKRLPKAGRP